MEERREENLFPENDRLYRMPICVSSFNHKIHRSTLHKILFSPRKRSLLNIDTSDLNSVNEVLDFPSCTEMAREGVLSPRPGINCVHDAEPAKAVLNREAFTYDVR